MRGRETWLEAADHGKVFAQRSPRDLIHNLARRVEGVRERFYAISPERKLKHAAVVNICLSARKDFFR